MRFLLSILILSNLIFATTEDEFRQIYGGSIYMLDDEILGNGEYTNNDITITNFALSGNYYFGDENSTYKPFILGGIGYSQYEDNSIDNKSFFGSLGGGLEVVSSEKFSSTLGLKQSMLYTDDTEIKTYKSSIFTEFSYHPKYGDINPYAILGVGYNYIKYDNDVDKTTGTDIKLKLGVIKENFFTLKDIPVTAEAYSRFLVLDKDLAKINDFDTLYTLGTAFMWKAGKMFDKSSYLSHIELKLHAQVSKSNKDLDGYNVGVGVKLFDF